MDLGHEISLENKHSWVIQSFNILLKYLLHNIVTLWSCDSAVTDMWINMDVTVQCCHRCVDKRGCECAVLSQM